MRFTDTHILDAIQAVVNDGTPNEGVGVVTLHREPFERLKQVLQFARDENQQARDLKYLTKQALETQTACNPRPVAVMLANAIHTVMQTGGNPAAEQSPLVRVILNTLLNILGPFHSLPAYDMDAMLYHRDVDTMEAFLKQVEETAAA
jgi:hypothetical protein